MQNSSLTIDSLHIVSDRKGAFALFFGLFMFIISIAGYAGLYYLNKSQEETQQRFIEQIQQKEDDLRPKILDQIFSVQKKLQTASSVLSAHQFSANTFGLIERDTHPRVRFESYSFSPKDYIINLKGEADDYAVLAKQIAFLEGDQQINKVEFSGLTLRENHRVSFGLAIHLMPTFTATMAPR